MSIRKDMEGWKGKKEVTARTMNLFLAFAAFLLVRLGPSVCVIDGNLIEIWWEMVIYRHLLRNNLT